MLDLEFFSINIKTNKSIYIDCDRGSIGYSGTFREIEWEGQNAREREREREREVMSRGRGGERASINAVNY